MRMPYHGLNSHQVNELKRLTAEELRAYADESVDLAAGLGGEIVVVGISGGGAVATWMAQNRPEVRQALPLSPFFGSPNVPMSVSSFAINLLSRVPNILLDDPLEPRREWVYRGEAKRGVAAFIRLGRFVLDRADQDVPDGEINFLITAVDAAADNDYTMAFAEQWQTQSDRITLFEFQPAIDIPHNSVDPAADPQKKAMVYEKILSLLGEN